MRARDAYRRALDFEAGGDAGGALALLWTASGLAPRDVEIQARLARRSNGSVRSMSPSTRGTSPREALRSPGR